jgi:hypothetical protein
MNAAEVLRAVSRIGPFFEVAVDPAESADPTWRPMAGLGPEGLHLAEYARRLGTTEPRVAASILFQSIAARLWSPVVAAAATYSLVPDLRDLHWRWLPGAPIALWLPEPTALDSADLADGVAASVLGMLRPVREVFDGVAKVADGLMWGNAASALAGTLRVAGGPRQAELVRQVLAREPLAGCGGFVRPGVFLRRSCCLYYRVPGGGYCGDCPLS